MKLLFIFLITFSLPTWALDFKDRDTEKNKPIIENALKLKGIKYSELYFPYNIEQFLKKMINNSRKVPELLDLASGFGDKMYLSSHSIKFKIEGKQVSCSVYITEHFSGETSVEFYNCDKYEELLESTVTSSLSAINDSQREAGNKSNLPEKSESKSSSASSQ